MSSSEKGITIDSLSSEESASGEEKASSGEAVIEKVISGEAKSGKLKVTLLTDASESVSNTVFIVKPQ